MQLSYLTKGFTRTIYDHSNVNMLFPSAYKSVTRFQKHLFVYCSRITEAKKAEAEVSVTRKNHLQYHNTWPSFRSTRLYPSKFINITLEDCSKGNYQPQAKSENFILVLVIKCMREISFAYP